VIWQFATISTFHASTSCSCKILGFPIELVGGTSLAHNFEVAIRDKEGSRMIAPKAFWSAALLLAVLGLSACGSTMTAGGGGQAQGTGVAGQSQAGQAEEKERN
jgi:hypothetical protein